MRHWNLENRKKQAELIHKWKPWQQSTGAKTIGGINISKMNALKHGMRSAEIIEFKQLLAKRRSDLERIDKMVFPFMANYKA